MAVPNSAGKEFWVLVSCESMIKLSYENPASAQCQMICDFVSMSVQERDVEKASSSMSARSALCNVEDTHELHPLNCAQVKIMQCLTAPDNASLHSLRSALSDAKVESNRILHTLTLFSTGRAIVAKAEKLLNARSDHEKFEKRTTLAIQSMEQCCKDADNPEKLVKFMLNSYVW